MKQHKPSTKAVTIFIAIIAALMLVPCMATAGQLQPTAPPGPTMRTLDQVGGAWIKVDPATRFVDNGDATILDRETGLTWTKNANIANGPKDWYEAANYCRTITVGNRKGWRLPTVEELSSLIDPSKSNPALPTGYPFINVQLDDHYWSSTEVMGIFGYAWSVHLFSGDVESKIEADYNYMWPVRGGQ